MKRYMLDTDTSSYIIRNRPESVRVRLGKLDGSQWLSMMSPRLVLRGQLDRVIR